MVFTAAAVKYCAEAGVGAYCYLYGVRVVLKKKAFFYVVGTVSVVVVGLFLKEMHTRGQEFKIRAKEKEGISMLNAAYAASVSTEAEGPQRIQELGYAGFNPIGNTRVYITEEKIPAQYRELIPKNMRPFFKDSKKFRILSIVEHEELISLFVLEENKKMNIKRVLKKLNESTQ